MVKVTATIYKRSKNWVALLYIVDGINPPRRKSITTDVPITKSEKTARKSAEEIRRRYEEELNNNLKVNQIAENSNDSILFCDYMLSWLEMIKPNVRQTTYGGYERIIKKRIYPYFKNLNITLTELNPIHIQAFYTYLFKEKKLKGATVKKYHANILSALSYAEKIDLIVSNPAKKVDTPKVEPYVPTFYNKDELQLLFSIIKDTNIKIPILIGAFYGFRREEILGLKWDAIDFENKTISIKHTVTEYTLKGEMKRKEKDRTKNKSSVRTLPLVEPFEKLLLKLLDQRSKNMKMFKTSYSRKYMDYIYVDEMGERIKPGYVTQTYQKVLKRNNLKVIRFHDLRHSCATLLYNNGVDLKDIQHWLGHSTITTTANIYTHFDYSRKIDSAKIMMNTLQGINKNI